jgi:predicted choloylglycine hydrolase
MLNKKKWKKIFIYSSASIVLLIAIFVIYFKFAVTINPPLIDDFSPLNKKRIQVNKYFYKIDNNWIKKNKYGLWELYVEGDPFKRGVIFGKLSQELMYRQESDLIKQINKMIPSVYYLNIIKLFVAWFNKDLDSYIDNEYLKEIYGVSQSASHQFDYIASGYQRILNYHAAHDIGHALQGMHIIGCTSFSAWGNKSYDGNLIVGRNFDFYVGDDFAQNKIVAFINPSNGYKFMMVTWGGMIGVVSGMNEKGLTVTLNAAKSEIPLSAATPISIVAREILQYAKNINEAYSIATKHKVFVSESIMIGSLEDNKTVIIEKTPSETDLYSRDDNYIICTNHYQGEKLKNSKLNIENKNESASLYRFNRVAELMNVYPKISYKNAAAILRDQKGIANADIGMGNEKVINQLIAHHSIIFEPAKKLVWVSSNPYQLGAYVAYDLNKVFSSPGAVFNNPVLNEESLTISPDTFLTSINYIKFERYKEIKKTIKKYLSSDSIKTLDKSLLNEFVLCNPDYYDVYSLLGDYYKKNNDYANAIVNYKKALTKEVPTLKEANAVRVRLNKCLNHR